ncbi:MAG: hypothetical protein JW929_12595 [Anaerolineales bacterium]|nr:hypothetical protein [Anaerolineales bacterium]
MQIHPARLRMVVPFLILGSIPCSTIGRLFPATATAAPPLLPSLAAVSTAAETLTPPPTATRRPIFTSTPPCVALPGSEEMRAAQREADVLIPGATVTWFDDFICRQLDYGWGTGGSNPTMKISTVGGVVRIQAEEYEDIWEGLGRTQSTIRDGMGFLVRSRYEERTTANLALVTGVWRTASNHSWMLAFRYDGIQRAGWEGWEGTEWQGADSPHSMLKAGEWYYLLIRLGKLGQITAEVWGDESPESRTKIRRNMNAGWAGRDWAALFQVYAGALELDRYWEAEFSGDA